MTMPASPNALNMAGTSSPVSVAYELGLGLTTTISMNQAAVRTLAGVGGSGTTWSMSSLHGKSNAVLAFTGGSFGSNISGSALSNPCSLVLTFTSTGTITTAGTGTYGWNYAPTGFVTGGSTSGLSIRLQASWSASGVPSVVFTVFGTTVNVGAGTYDSGYVSFAGTNKVIQGTSATLSRTLALTGTISITDGTTTITSSVDQFDLQV